MKPIPKKIIAVAVSILLVAVAYYGSYLPLKKSRTHIQVARNIAGTLSVGEFQEKLSLALDAPSPIGQEEIVRQAASMSLNILKNSGNPPVIIESLVNFVKKYYEPLVSRGYGLSFGQDLYLLGVMNEVAFINTGESRYLNSAKKYFLLGRTAGPSRPQPLYGLFDIYRAEGNLDGVREIASQILDQWPDDENTRRIYSGYLEEVGAK